MGAGVMGLQTLLWWLARIGMTGKTGRERERQE
jgi:hypothetical protein